MRIMTELADRIGMENMDRGWAWVVLAGCMLSNVFMMGFSRSFGLFFVEFLDLFQESSSSTSIIMGVHAAAFSLTGLVVLAIFTEMVNCRTLVMAGGVAFCVGVTVSSFAQSLLETVIFIGVFGGAGQAFIYGPNLVMLAKYFDKRRGLAIGLSECGGSLGQLALPPFIRSLIHVFSFRGALLIFGGLVLNCTVCGALLRPLPDKGEAVEETAKEVEPRDNGRSFRSTKARDDKRELGSQPIFGDAHLQTSDVEIIQKSLPNVCISVQTTVIVEHHQNSLTHLGSRKNQPSLEELHHQRYNQLIPIAHHHQSTETTNTGASLRCLFNGGLLSGSVCSLHTQKSGQRDQPAIDKTIEDGVCCRRSKFLTYKGKPLLNCDILKDFLFILFLLTAVLGYVGCTAQVVFILPHAKDNGVADDEIPILLSVMGACDLGSRILLGLVADTGLVERCKILMTGLFILGISAHLTFLAKLFWHFLVLSIVYGICGGFLSNLAAVVLVDFFGVKMLSKSLGIVFLFQGISVMAINPLLGWLRDQTGSYDATFHVIGACLVLGGTALLPAKMLQRWRIKQTVILDIPKDENMSRAALFQSVE